MIDFNNSEKVKVAIICEMCQKTHVIEVYQKDLDELKEPKSQRRAIQLIFPYLSREIREMFISQICPKCFKLMFKED